MTWLAQFVFQSKPFMTPHCLRRTKKSPLTPWKETCQHQATRIAYDDFQQQINYLLLCDINFKYFISQVFKLRAAHRDLSHSISKLADSSGTALEKFRTSVVEEYYENISSLMVSTCFDCIDTVEFLVKRYSIIYTVFRLFYQDSFTF